MRGVLLSQLTALLKYSWLLVELPGAIMGLIFAIYPIEGLLFPISSLLVRLTHTLKEHLRGWRDSSVLARLTEDSNLVP